MKPVRICPICNTNPLLKRGAKQCSQCYRERFQNPATRDDVKAKISAKQTERWAKREFHELSPTAKKKRILEEQGGVCLICGQGTVWNGKPLTLQLDHIDGNNRNNLRTNLRVICPNCHTQTPTFCSRAISPEAKLRVIEGAKRGAAAKWDSTAP